MKNKEFIKVIKKVFRPNINIVDLAIKVTYYQYKYNEVDLYYYDKKEKKWLTKLMPIIENAFKIRWWMDKNKDFIWDIYNNTLTRQQKRYHELKKD
jgi:hypothetical protein